ncbi:unnamed protein product [Penicillium palitans]
MFEYGEAHFLSLLVDLKDTWADFPGVTSDTPLPFDFSEMDIEHIKLDSQIWEQLAETDEEKAEYQRYWPFE